jgi:hypothetical protein
VAWACQKCGKTFSEDQFHWHPQTSDEERFIEGVTYEAPWKVPGAYSWMERNDGKGEA